MVTHSKDPQEVPLGSCDANILVQHYGSASLYHACKRTEKGFNTDRIYLMHSQRWYDRSGWYEVDAVLALDVTPEVYEEYLKLYWQREAVIGHIRQAMDIAMSAVAQPFWEQIGQTHKEYSDKIVVLLEGGQNETTG